MRRQLAVISSLTALSQLAAFFKLWFTARVFGVGSDLDGYNLALVVPVLISSVMAGVLQTGFFPVRARLNVQSGVEATESFERTILWASAAAGLVFTVMTMAAVTWLAEVITPANQPAMRAAFLIVMPFSAALIVLNMSSDCAGYLLAVRGKFYYAASAPILNGLLGGVLLAWWPQGGLYNLVIGTVAGTAAQLCICLYGLRRSNLSLMQAWPKKAVFLRLRDVLKLGAWVLPGAFFSNFVVSLPPVWAASFGEGAVSAFGYAYRIHTSAVQLLVMASSTLILTRFSELVAAGQGDAVRRLLRHAALLSLGIGLTGVFAVWAVGEPLLLWLFSGHFDAVAAARVTALWTWLTVGLGFTLLSNVFAKLWQAQSRPRLISVMAASSLFALCASFFTLRGVMQEQAIAMAMAASGMAVVLFGFRFLNPGPRSKSIPG